MQELIEKTRRNVDAIEAALSRCETDEDLARIALALMTAGLIIDIDRRGRSLAAQGLRQIADECVEAETVH